MSEYVRFDQRTPLKQVIAFSAAVSAIVTLTTDFGTQDAYVGALKGILLGLCPDARIVDISHTIAPQDIMECAFVLREAAWCFPPGAIHLAVVDPGVGTDRRPVALRCGEHFFTGPDNGIFSLVLDGAPPDACIQLDRPQYWRTDTPSQTFHGRDIFAPAAAHLANGTPIERLGSAIDRLAPMKWARPITDDHGVQGWVVHIDRFGNCITNIPRNMVEERRTERPVKCFAGNTVLEGVQPTYAAVEAGEPLLQYNSSDLLEVAVNAGNAAELLSIRKGNPVHILFT